MDVFTYANGKRYKEEKKTREYSYIRIKVNKIYPKIYNKDEKHEQGKIVSERLSLIQKFTGQQLQKTMHYHCKTIATQQTQSTSPA